jgi:hypothetical protein
MALDELVIKEGTADNASQESKVDEVIFRARKS